MWRTWPREPLLLSVAKRVAAASKDWGWSADDERFAVEIPSSHDAAHPVVLTRRSVQTGQTHSAPLPHCPRGTHTNIALSPDGQRVLCWDTGGFDRIGVVESLADKQVVHWPLKGDTYHYPVLWMPDSRRWVSIATLASGYLMLYSLQRPTTPEHLPFAEGPQLCWQEYAVSRTNHLCVLMTRNIAPPLTQLHILDFQLEPTVQRCQDNIVRLPFSGEIKQHVLSPTGEALAVEVEQHYVSPLLAWVHRLYPPFVPRVQTHHSLWVCSIKGKYWHEVGALPPGADASTLSSLEWLPSGKRLSFEFDDTLYTVPAE